MSAGTRSEGPTPTPEQQAVLDRIAAQRQRLRARHEARQQARAQAAAQMPEGASGVLQALLYLRQHPLGLKYRVHGFQQAHHAGSWGWSARAKQPIALRNAMRRFFRRLRKTSSGGCSCGPSSMRTFNTAGGIRKTINGRGKEWRFDFKALTAPSAHGHGKNATRE